MSSKRIKVWVQRFKDRPHLVLQWTDPDTGRRKSRSAETADAKEADGRVRVFCHDGNKWFRMEGLEPPS